MRLGSIALLALVALSLAVLAFFGRETSAPPPSATETAASSVESSASSPDPVQTAPSSLPGAIDVVRTPVVTTARRVSDADTRLILRWTPIEGVTIRAASVSIEHRRSRWKAQELVPCVRGTEEPVDGETGRRFEGIVVDGAPAGPLTVQLGPFVLAERDPAGGRGRVTSHRDPGPRVANTAEYPVESRVGEPTVVRIPVRLAVPVRVHVVDPEGVSRRGATVRLGEWVPSLSGRRVERPDNAVLTAGDEFHLFRSFPRQEARVVVLATGCDPVDVPLPPGVRELRIEVHDRASLDVAADGVRFADGFRLSIRSGDRCSAGVPRSDPEATTRGSLRATFAHVGSRVWDVVLRWRSRDVAVLGSVTLEPHERRAVRFDASRFAFLPVEFRVDSSMAPPGCLELEGVTTDVRRTGTIRPDGRVELRLPADRYRVLLRNGRDRWPADRELVVEAAGDAGVLRFR